MVAKVSSVSLGALDGLPDAAFKDPNALRIIAKQLSPELLKTHDLVQYNRSNGIGVWEKREVTHFQTKAFAAVEETMGTRLRKSLGEGQIEWAGDIVEFAKVSESAKKLFCQVTADAMIEAMEIGSSRINAMVTFVINKKNFLGDVIKEISDRFDRNPPSPEVLESFLRVTKKMTL